MNQKQSERFKVLGKKNHKMVDVNKGKANYGNMNENLREYYIFYFFHEIRKICLERSL